MAAKSRLPHAVFSYIDGAAEDESTLRRNRQGFARQTLIPRVLIDVGDVDLSTTILGTKVELPVIFAPTGMSRLFHHYGELAVARAAQKSGAVYSLSTLSTYSIEEVAAVNKGPKWFQIYVLKDRNLLLNFIHRCRDAGYEALCLTVDMPTFGHRERELKSGMTVPPRPTLRTMIDTLRRPDWLWHYLTSPTMSLSNVIDSTSGNSSPFSLADFINTQFDPSVTWDDAKWMIRHWGGPFVIKGIMCVEDARKAADIGADAIVVSNHGGRQLDHAPATIDVLPAIVDAVGRDVEVLVDGGIRRGTDVLKALALGAKGCLIGRAYLYGLGAGGEAGVLRAMELLRSEIRRAMMLTGCQSLAGISRDLIRPDLDSLLRCVQDASESNHGN